MSGNDILRAEVIFLAVKLSGIRSPKTLLTINEPRNNHLEFLTNIWKYRWQYGMILPGLILLFLFSYMPMLGIQVAFKDFQIGTSMWTSPWVGLQNFEFLKNTDFWRVLSNTLAITFLRLVFGFPAPIILALMINEIRSEWFKRTIQSVSYIPHFISWVVVVYILDSLLSPTAGPVNMIINALGGHSIFFRGETAWFRPLVVITGIWKDVGWGTIIYLAALSNIDPQLYEAAVMDGAGKWRQLLHISLPGLLPTILILFMLNMPSLINAGLEQIYPMVTPANLQVSDILETYVLRNGLQQGYFGMSAAVGLLASFIALILVVVSNKLVKMVGGEGLW